MLKDYLTKDRYGFTKIELEFSRLKRDPPYKVKPSPCLAPDYDSEVNEKKFRCYIYTGDSEGYIKLWDLTHVLVNCGFDPVKSYLDTKTSFLASRKDTIDVSAYSANLIKQAEAGRITMPKAFACTGLVIREVKAHSESVSKITTHRQGGIISCSPDLHVNVWSSGLDLWGSLNQKTNSLDSLWKFPEKNARERVAQELSTMQ